MAEAASISQGIAARYATALFELSKETGSLKALETDVEAVKAALAESPELVAVIASPIISRGDQVGAITAIAAKMNLSPLVANTLSLMAEKRRIYALPQLLAQVAALIAEEKGEVTAEVTAATALSAAQTKKLAEVLKAKVGKVVKLNTTVDESLIGGMIVRLGSTMIDTSVRSQLAALQNAMKEVG